MTDQPIYDQAFYDAIIHARRQADSNGYVSIDECMRAMGRTFDSTPDDKNERTFENE